MVNYSEFETVFYDCDVNGDGKISAQELQHCLSLVCEEITCEEVEEIVKSVDSDGDGLLGLDEFVALVKGKEEEEVDDLKEAFRLYVMDEPEGITPRSLKRMLSRLGESRTVDDCIKMISQFDINGDGILNFEEFRIMMQ
ncbi:hypothetical protein ACHQM5_010626 [Ranunculus cassubicifolius]